MEDKLYKDIMHYHTESAKNTPDIRPYPSEILRLPSLNGTLVHGEIDVLVKRCLASIFHVYHDNPTTGAHFGRVRHLPR